MTEDQIKHMVNRFLGWRLPENFSPDDGISFNPIAGEHGPHPFRRTPIGTNLFDATQADAMVRYMVEGLPAPSGNAPEPAGWKLVPIEPTQEMLDQVTSSEGYEPFTDKTMREIYQEMVNAAPASGNAQEAVTSTERPDCLLKHSPACALSHTDGTKP